MRFMRFRTFRGASTAEEGSPIGRGADLGPLNLLNPLNP
jgi:hypothetical protein